MGDVIGSARPGLFDLGRHKVAGLLEAATGFDLLEMRPRLCSKGFGEILDVPRAARGIEDPADMGLLEQ